MLKNKQGITLVELLIVIVIMGIIAAIAIPAVGNIVENTQKDAVLTDARTIANQARTACLTETWGACDFDWDEEETPAELGAKEHYLTGDDEELGAYVEGINTEGFVAWYYGGTWLVAIETEDWVFVGDPSEDGRASVLDAEGKVAITELDETHFEQGSELAWPDEPAD